MGGGFLYRRRGSALSSQFGMGRRAPWATASCTVARARAFTQLEERRPYEAEVGGSRPSTPTRREPGALRSRWALVALDGRALYGWAKTVGYLYEARLRAELTRRLGVSWVPVRNGIADVDGFSREVLREYSTRRREIEMHLEEHGETGARAAQVAAYATRKAKDVEKSTESLLPGWRERARRLGVDETALASLVDPAAGSQSETSVGCCSFSWQRPRA